MMGEIYYTDTDSIFAGYTVNNLNKSIGEITWSKTYDDAVFISSKFYCLSNNEIKLKGINNNNYNFEHIKNLFYNNNYSLMYNNQLTFTKKNSILIQKYIDKEILISSYDKRLFIENKKKLNL